MKPTPVILIVASVLVTAAAGVVGWILWRRYEHDSEVMLDQTDLSVSVVQRAMTLWFLNHADSSELAAAGIHERQRQLILDNRPIRSLAVLSDINGIGGGTLRSAIQAASD